PEDAERDRRRDHEREEESVAQFQRGSVAACRVLLVSWTGFVQKGKNTGQPDVCGLCGPAHAN
ncbi:MAG: hypothetical protein ACK4N5_22015, partial [Myxococcales bacterium]